MGAAVAECTPGQHPYMIADFPSGVGAVSATTKEGLLPLVDAGIEAHPTYHVIVPAAFEGEWGITGEYFDGEGPWPYFGGIHELCTGGYVEPTGGPEPGALDWSSESMLLQALLVLVLVITFAMGYRAGDKT